MDERLDDGLLLARPLEDVAAADLCGQDSFDQDRGRLDAKLWGLVPVAHARGTEIDQGEIQRYLAELAWNPLAILHNPELRFDAGEEPGSIRVWCRAPEVHVDLSFDSSGDIVRTFTRTRSRDGGDPQPWEGRFSDYADFDGRRLPRKGNVSWLSENGAFEYFRGEITHVSWQKSTRSSQIVE